jgi:hypothetical protein
VLISLRKTNKDASLRAWMKSIESSCRLRLAVAPTSIRIFFLAVCMGGICVMDYAFADALLRHY